METNDLTILRASVRQLSEGEPFDSPQDAATIIARRKIVAVDANGRAVRQKSV